MILPRLDCAALPGLNFQDAFPAQRAGLIFHAAARRGTNSSQGFKRILPRRVPLT